MQVSSAFLALVLQCSTSLHPAPFDPIVTSHVFIQPIPSGAYGSVLPCPEQKLGVTVTTAAQGKKGDFAKDLDPIIASPLLIAEADLDDILPGQPGSLKGTPGAVQLNVPVAAQPTFESWDVLRQYPRTAPLSEPRTSAPKPTEPPNTPKDSKDAQGKTST